MTNPTSNFGWQMPTSTDLVTDLPADFEVFGQAVDTSLADLKGGTTGQVLSKASNTNMDFTWVTSDDANAIQNTIVDAKGDLIAASASDTPARLAVGANYGFLQADSAQSTGLAWNNATWTTYSVTPVPGSGAFTSASATARYTRVGKLCVVAFSISIATNGTAGTNINIAAPFTSGQTGGQGYTGVFREAVVVGNSGFAYLGGAGTNIAIVTVSNGYPGGNGYVLNGTLSYEVA
jgi:hypothetical protein